MIFLFPRNLLIAASIGVILAVLPVVTQAEEVKFVAEEIEQSRALNDAKRQATINANVNFTTEEMGKFWPAYWEYRTAVGKVDEEYVRLVQDYANNYQSMHNSKAKKIIESWLQIEIQRVDLKKTYIAKFESVLPAAKALKVMQIENKLDIMIAASVQKQIPLAIPSD